MRAGLIWPGFVLLGLAALSAKADQADALPGLGFVAGHYQLIGRYPDSMRTYTGTARIERVGSRLQLSRTVAGRTSHVFGSMRRADPGEANVLSFVWGNRPAMEMVCLIGGDLDNYARLTCRWGTRGNPHKQAGMEAYFASEP